MRLYSFYDAQTGLFTGGTFSTNVAEPCAHSSSVAANTPAGCAAIEGRFDHLAQRLDVERVAREDSDALTAWSEHKDGPAPSPVVATAAHMIDYQPPAPSADHEWSASTKRWQLSAAAQANATAVAVAKARHAALIAGQHDDLRRAVLGDAAALARLQAIEEQVMALQSP